MTVSRATTRRRAGRRAFTLVELMIVMLIIALLAATMAVVYVGAAEKSKEGRTRSEIAKIDQLLRSRWESYQTRRVPIPPNAAARDPMRFAKMRLNGLRELQRMEMPDRITDVKDPPKSLVSPPALWQTYQRLASSSNWEKHPSYQGAECLYMILKTIQDGETTGLEFFHQDEIGDTDDDGMPEILDAWGHPIEFLRWAPGFFSPLQPRDPKKRSPDPFDPLDVDHPQELDDRGFLLYPLVFSAGPDGKYEIATDGKPRVSYAGTNPPNDPYTTAGGGQKLGSPVDQDGDGYAGHIDNIHNHLLGTRVH